MATDKIYKWGIIGCGLISSDFCNCLTASPRAKIAACASRNINSANEFAKKFDIPIAYGSYNSLIKDDTIDIVYIGTIHSTHYSIVISSLMNGKNVLCEKPIGINEREVKSMIDCAQRNKCFLMEALWTRFFPVTKQVKKWINDGKIGNIVSVSSDFSMNFIENDRSWLWSNKFNGGNLMSVGCYMIDCIVRVFGTRMPEISAIGIIDSKHKIDMITLVNMLYRDTNQYGQIRGDAYSWSNEECYIIGSLGVIKINRMHSPTNVELYKCDFMEKKCIESKEFPLLDSSRFKYKDFIYQNSAGLYYEIEEVIKCLDKSLLQTNEYKWEEMLLNVKILDEIRRQIGLTFPQDKCQHKL
eukprot:174052_1